MSVVKMLLKFVVFAYAAALLLLLCVVAFVNLLFYAF